MDQKEEKKIRIFSSIHTSKKVKRKYFKVEKNRNNLLSKDKESKKIFRTQKEYNLLKRKTQREFLKNSLSKNNNKFITETEKEGISPPQEVGGGGGENSFLVLKILPQKIKIVKENKKDLMSNNENYLKENNINTIINTKKNFLNNIDNRQNFKWAGLIEEKEINNNNKEYKMKLKLVYLYYIKNLCKYINKNFFESTNAEQNICLDGFLYQIYQSLQILDRKINNFNLIQNAVENLKINKEEFHEIFSLKENLLLMKNILNNNMSQNLINIYIDIENFCKQFCN